MIWVALDLFLDSVDNKVYRLHKLLQLTTFPKPVHREFHPRNRVLELEKVLMSRADTSRTLTGVGEVTTRTGAMNTMKISAFMCRRSNRK